MNVLSRTKPLVAAVRERIDVPCVGPDTTKSLAANGAKCLVLEAGRTIIIDRRETLEMANRRKICVIGK